MEFSAGANLNFFALYAFWEHVKFCEDLGNYWSRTGQRQRCIVYLYCVSELETNSVWIFGTQPEATCFPKYHGPWYRFGFQASIHYYSILRCSNIQGFNLHQDDMFQISPGWPGGIPLTSQPSWCMHLGYKGERGTPAQKASPKSMELLPESYCWWFRNRK